MYNMYLITKEDYTFQGCDLGEPSKKTYIPSGPLSAQKM